MYEVIYDEMVDTQVAVTLHNPIFTEISMGNPKMTRQKDSG
jgi:hypothetical protein